MNFSKSLLAIVALAFLASCGTSNTSTTSTQATTTQATTETTSSSATTAANTTTFNGQTAQSSAIIDVDHENDTETYQTPGGAVTVRFSATKNDNTDEILSASVAFVSGDAMSKGFVEKFSKELSQTVVGKKVSEISGIMAIGGASLTTTAFIDFID